MVFIEEQDPRNENLGTWVIYVQPSLGWVDPFAVAHGNDSSLSFADGHAVNHKWVDDKGHSRQLVILRREKASFYWAGGNARNPDFRWVHDRLSS